MRFLELMRAMGQRSRAKPRRALLPDYEMEVITPEEKHEW
jgi:hypothetical protein